ALVSLGSAECLSDLIMTLLQKPFTLLSGSIVTKVILTVCTSFLWFFGIHGGMVIGSVTNLLFTQATLENIAAGAAGEPLPHIITTGMTTLSGGTENLAAAVAILLFVKRDDLRAIAKLAFVPALFNISEPIRFGIPTVLNPTMFVPAVFTSALMDILTYIVVRLGLVSKPRIAGIFGTPVFLDAFAMGGISGLIWSFICFALRLVIWAFFLKLFERQKNREDDLKETAE
ncbi:MAG: PTS sugar transporter subunit IIC, partial [Erysipelotrichaceae bacterium]|nr:PTS sugar transporter subunit IIC [Erysipelotrichaceae bacterium]